MPIASHLRLLDGNLVQEGDEEAMKNEMIKMIRNYFRFRKIQRQRKVASLERSLKKMKEEREEAEKMYLASTDIILQVEMVRGLYDMDSKISQAEQVLARM